MSPSTNERLSIIDSHVHLFGEPHLENLAWMTPDNVLSKNHRLDEYLASNCKANEKRAFDVEGLIFLESDVKCDINDKQYGYDKAVEEYLWIERIIDANLKAGEGDNNVAKSNDFIKAIVPWAPVINGAEELQKYVHLLKSKSQGDKAFNRVKGLRYLLQDKPPGTMLKPSFAEGLNWLATNNYVFDLGIDLRSGGLWQFEEFCQLIDKTENVTFIVNHLTKPDLHIDPSDFETSEKISQWKNYVTKMAHDKKNSYYIKLSGGFSELPPSIADDIEKCTQYVFPWFKFLVESFGVDHIIWGSDWPVCTINGGPNALEKWTIITKKLFSKLGIDDIQFLKQNVFKAYNIQVDDE